MWPFSSSTPSPAPSAGASACPVDHETRAAYLAANGRAPHPSPWSSSSALPNDREISSIPRHHSSIPSSEASSATAPPPESENWVYPSQAQFFAAMQRKGHNPREEDMRTIVPIHNAVNERAWAQILEWEEGQGGDQCGGPRLASFQGRPKDRTPKAWVKVALGYSPPFDRHDWVVDRCGRQIRYVIDFYSGRTPVPPSTPGVSTNPLHSASYVPSFYLDVRPAVDDFEGVRMRAERLARDWLSWGNKSVRD